MKIQFPELPYALNALDACIDAQTLDIHYNKHHRKYYDKFVEAIGSANTDGIESLEQLFSNISKYKVGVRNNAGGVYNHTLFWNSMTPNYRDCAGPLRTAIEKKWKTMEEFEKKFSEASLALFGSGWVWLILDDKKELQIIETPNQDNPLMDLSPIKGKPLLVLDIWEHAYYLRYKNERGGFIQAWWDIVNWKNAEDMYAALQR